MMASIDDVLMASLEAPSGLIVWLYVGAEDLSFLNVFLLIMSMNNKLMVPVAGVNTCVNKNSKRCKTLT